MNCCTLRNTLLNTASQIRFDPPLSMSLERILWSTIHITKLFFPLIFRAKEYKKPIGQRLSNK